MFFVRHPAIAAVLGFTACGNVATSAGNPDAAIAQGDAAVPLDAQLCFGTSVPICLQAPPTASRVISTATAISTDDPTQCAATSATAAGFCVIAATDIAISASLQATGKLPLILVATNSITVTATGVIDVGSHRNPARIGAGAEPVSCQVGTKPTGTAGGAGGSFLGAGGVGGTGTSGANLIGGGAPGAVATKVTQPRGGCAGQDGPNSGSGIAGGGHGGGAVYLIAGSKIDIEGTIDAAGEGGGGAPAGKTTTSQGTAGGGGGSGGMIGFEAPAITVEGVLLANGGGGGGGTNNQFAASSAPDPTMATAAAGGGGDTDNGAGNGGAGSPPTSATAPGAPGRDVKQTVDATHPNPGAGGGGGGAGIILAPAQASLGTQLSPPATPLP